jgi:hypothetical protein
MTKSEWEAFFSALKENYEHRVFGFASVVYVLRVETDGPFPLGSVAIAWEGDGDSTIRYVPFHLRPQTRLLENF